MSRYDHRDPHPFHRQGACRGYTPPPPAPVRQHWLVTVGVMISWGVIIIAGVGVALPLIRWVLGGP